MNMFRKDKLSTAQTPELPPRPVTKNVDASVSNVTERRDASQETEAGPPSNTKTKRSGVMGVMQKVNPFKSSSQASLASSSSSSSVTNAPSLESLESKQAAGGFRGVMQKVNPFKFSSQVSKTSSSESLNQNKASNPDQGPQIDPKDDSRSSQESLRDVEDKQNPGKISGVFQKVNPFKSSQTKEPRPLNQELSSSSGSLTEKQSHRMGFRDMMHKVNPFRTYTQLPEGESQTDSGVSSVRTEVHSDSSTSSESLDADVCATETRSVWYVDDDVSSEVKSQPAPKKRTMTFRIKRILPSALFGTKSSSNVSNADTEAQTQVVEVQTLEFAEVPVPGEETAEDPLDDEEGLLAWWRSVEGWEEWNEANQDDEAEEVVEEAADRVFMAARLFVRFFNQRGGSLQQRILELLSLADAADNFHKKTVTASVGGGVASVAGSITTITGLILAPFTAGTSLIVTAVGIGIATAGGVASASANITDTVHSKTDRKKVEKMIQDYQEEIRDIKECLDFLQAGMETLEEWNFEQYAETIAKKHLNQNVKHVMKEGGRAGKALVLNTESLISTVQVLSVAGGAAKAAQVMSVTTGVMSGLFLALDVFFLAKDSAELKKGAKTEFASKIRDVCKDLQDGLLELNHIKEELQRTMDGIEVEVTEDLDEEVLKSDLKKLYELEE
ncbi:uncharacterized protein apold1b [Gouania willdenowi]|uniref:uncharacterized protein apold1b n=1 Tax=Gouania willdenowi TaxID=441366 RepID=UPI001055E889|nr:uncharacterized protein LOC114480083 [Gouania willdenowi]XP_028329691.1 uncharacterized protein LOC114480083 [Gouania willdenowi]XP_028329692.1 uncharacterized protein LOC114480083 [Gouania willdenowi]XP_028329693.1 uncharacterized protein LOC114480083 [Gouania willdenowi]